MAGWMEVAAWRVGGLAGNGIKARIIMNEIQIDWLRDLCLGELKEPCSGHFRLSTELSNIRVCMCVCVCVVEMYNR